MSHKSRPITFFLKRLLISHTTKEEIEPNMLAVDYYKIENHDERCLDLFRLRYRVYCDERGFENPEEYPEMMERDEYDEHAIHFGNTVGSHGEIGGTVRMILNSEKGFPIENNFFIDQKLRPDFDRNRIAEISRLAISKAFRRRAADEVIYSEKLVDITSKNNVYKKDRRREKLNLTFGLYSCIYKESLKRGLTHLYAAMNDGLCSLLSRQGYIWHPIGPKINYHGWRRPYIADIAENTDATRNNFRILDLI